MYEYFKVSTYIYRKDLSLNWELVKKDQLKNLFSNSSNPQVTSTETKVTEVTKNQCY